MVKASFRIWIVDSNVVKKCNTLVFVLRWYGLPCLNRPWSSVSVELTETRVELTESRSCYWEGC